MALMVISVTSLVQVKSACTPSFNEADRCEIAVPVLLPVYPHYICQRGSIRQITP